MRDSILLVIMFVTIIIAMMFIMVAAGFTHEYNNPCSRYRNTDVGFAPSRCFNNFEGGK